MEDEFGNVSFVGMQRVPLIFYDRPLFSELYGRAREELECTSNDDVILVEGVIHYGKSGRVFSRLFPIQSEVAWGKYVNTVMKNDCPCLDVVVRKLSVHPPPIIHCPRPVVFQDQDNPGPSEPVVPIREELIVAPDAHSAPNEVGSIVPQLAPDHDIPFPPMDENKMSN